MHRVTGVEQCCNQQLTTHLLTNFLLFSSGGHKIAQECIYHVSVSSFFSRLTSIHTYFTIFDLSFYLLIKKTHNRELKETVATAAISNLLHIHFS